MKEEMFWAIESRIVDLKILLETDDASFLDQWEYEELTNQYRYWKQRSRLHLVQGGLA